MSLYTVKSAVYGALDNSNPAACHAKDVRQILQHLLDGGAARIAITNDSMGGDPLVGIGKHFAAVVASNGADHVYACGEGQAIDFGHPGNIGGLLGGEMKAVGF